MARNFRTKLTVILILFSLLLSFIIAAFDYKKLRENVLLGQATQIAMAEDKIIGSLSAIDKAYGLFEDDMAGMMKDISLRLVDQYEKQNDFSLWDFEKLSSDTGLDIFILDDQNTVIYSNLSYDVGLDFNECCSKFAKLLDERRNGDAFSHDGMDIQSKTGEIKKFSYMPTPDHAYLIELAVSLEDQDIFKTFNFLGESRKLVTEYDIIENISVYNSGGFLLGHRTQNFDHKKIEEPFLSMFKEVNSSGIPQEMPVTKDGHDLTYRYIPYKAEEKRGYSTNRVVEIVYNNSALEGLLNSYKNQFISQLAIILAASVFLSFVIGKLVAQPIHLAFHDSMTGLRNRAAFEAEFNRARKRGTPMALLMIDLDNFKNVNDKLGHREGDRILKLAALSIEEVACHPHVAARVGGDEFLILLKTGEDDVVRKKAEAILYEANERLKEFTAANDIGLSVSIGVAHAEQGDDFATLYEKADKALYISKENGKNRFSIFHKDQCVTM